VVKGALAQARQTLMALGEERLPVSKNPIPGEAVPNTYTGKGGSRRE